MFKGKALESRGFRGVFRGVAALSASLIALSGCSGETTRYVYVEESTTTTTELTPTTTTTTTTELTPTTTTEPTTTTTAKADGIRVYDLNRYKGIPENIKLSIACLAGEAVLVAYSEETTREESRSSIGVGGEVGVGLGIGVGVGLGTSSLNDATSKRLCAGPRVDDETLGKILGVE